MAAVPRPSERAARTMPALIDLVGRACAARRARGGPLVSLAQAVPGFPPPLHVREALRAALDDPLVHRYTVDPGLGALRHAIARVLGGEARGVEWDPEEQIVVTAGANQGFAEVLPALVDPGDEVLLLAPYYLNHGMAAELMGCRVVEVPLDPDRAFAADLDALDRATSARARVLVLVNPSNPTGAVLGRRDVARLVAFAAERDLWVVSDETYEDFVLDPPPDGWASAASVGHPDRVIVLGSFSKSAGLSGWRVGWVAGPPGLMREVLKCHDTMIICAPVAAQHGALAALHGDRAWLSPLREELDRRRRATLRAVAQSAHLASPGDASRGAMFVFVRPRERLLADSLAAALFLIEHAGGRPRAGSRLRPGRRGVAASLLRHGNRPRDRGGGAAGGRRAAVRVTGLTFSCRAAAAIA